MAKYARVNQNNTDVFKILLLKLKLLTSIHNLQFVQLYCRIRNCQNESSLCEYHKDSKVTLVK